jgi:hypothetical protein
MDKKKIIIILIISIFFSTGSRSEEIIVDILNNEARYKNDKKKIDTYLNREDLKNIKNFDYTLLKKEPEEIIRNLIIKNDKALSLTDKNNLEEKKRILFKEDFSEINLDTNNLIKSKYDLFEKKNYIYFVKRLFYKNYKSNWQYSYIENKYILQKTFNLHLLEDNTFFFLKLNKHIPEKLNLKVKLKTDYETIEFIKEFNINESNSFLLKTGNKSEYYGLFYFKLKDEIRHDVNINQVTLKEVILFFNKNNIINKFTYNITNIKEKKFFLNLDNNKLLIFQDTLDNKEILDLNKKLIYSNFNLLKNNLVLANNFIYKDKYTFSSSTWKSSLYDLIELLSKSNLNKGVYISNLNKENKIVIENIVNKKAINQNLNLIERIIKTIIISVVIILFIHLRLGKDYFKTYNLIKVNIFIFLLIFFSNFFLVNFPILHPVITILSYIILINIYLIIIQKNNEDYYK